MCMKLASVDAERKVHVVVFTRVSEDNGRTKHDHAVQTAKCQEMVQSWYQQYYPGKDPKDLEIIHIGENEQTGYHADEDVWEVENLLLSGRISALAFVNEERIGRAPAVASAMLACVTEGAKAGTSPGPVHLLCHSLSSLPQDSIGSRILDKITVSLHSKRIKQVSNHDALIDRQSRSFRVLTEAEDIFSFDDSGIATPLPNDYLPTEKGFDPSSNPGNIAFDRICSENFERHKNAGSAERGRINMEIVLAFKARGGRMLKRDNQTGLFYEIDVTTAKNKVSSWMTTRRGSRKKSAKSTGGSKTVKKSAKSTGGSKTAKTGASAAGSNVPKSSTRPRRRTAANEDTVQPRETDAKRAAARSRRSATIDTKRAAARSRRSVTKEKQKSRDDSSSDSECSSECEDECEDLGGVEAPTTTKAGRRKKASKNIQLSVEDDDEESDYVDE